MGSHLPKTACESVAQTGRVPGLLCCSLLKLQARCSWGEEGCSLPTGREPQTQVQCALGPGRPAEG